MKGLILFLSLTALSKGKEICPPAEVLFPCTCIVGFTYRIECRNISGIFNLKEIFDNASAFVNDDVIFESLDISYTELVEIEEGAIQHFKFNRISMGHNSNLEYISPRAFNASRTVTTWLSLGGMNIINQPPREHLIFDFVKSFTKLELLTMGFMSLTFIPDNGFQNLPFLRQIDLADNQISSIGSRAFNTGGSKLRQIDLYNNSISSKGFAADSFDGIASRYYLHLMFNPIEYMEQQGFQRLFDSNAILVQVGGCYASPCPYERLHCDERANWICQNGNINNYNLRGFRCKTGFEDIWQYCADRNAIHNQTF